MTILARRSLGRRTHGTEDQVVEVPAGGWVAERFKAPVLKTGVGASSPWVRIPPHPPNNTCNSLKILHFLNGRLIYSTLCSVPNAGFGAKGDD